MKKNIMKLCKTWIKSAAGKISLSLLGVSIVLLIVAYSSWGDLSEDAANNVNNILIGLGTNLLGIIVTVSFVQYFIDKQDKEEERKEEIAEIKRYDRFMSILILRYSQYVHCVITPINKRFTFDPLILKEDFQLEDMCDMYKQSLYLCSGCYVPSITLFYKAEEELRNYMIRIVENIQFKYNVELKEIIMSFVENSLASDVRSAVLGYMNVEASSGIATEEIEKFIKDSSYNWVEMYHKNELDSNMMVPYVLLFELLKIEAKLLNQYKNYLEKSL